MIRFMKSVEFRNSFKEMCDNATEGDIIYISRPKGGNVVLLSENEYNRMNAARKERKYST